MKTQAQATPNRHDASSASTLSLQRKCACGENAGLTGECEECRQKRMGIIQRSALGAGQPPVPPSVHHVLASPGQPLDASTRAVMEPRFGHDFSQVRVHTDARAAESARAVNAAAYTVGKHIVFQTGRYPAHSSANRMLLAHELAHVAQQHQSHPPQGTLGLNMSLALEADADKAAFDIKAGRYPYVTPARAPVSIQKQDGDRPLETAPVPRLPRQVIPGSTHLSRETQAYRIAHPDLPGSANLVAVEYSVGDGPRVTHVFENRAGVAHSEEMMDDFFRGLRREVRGAIAVHEIYSERQPCGPSDHDCEGLLIRRYPQAQTTFGYPYQEAEIPISGAETRARRTRSRVEEAHRRVTESGQLEWDFERRPVPPHHERLDEGSRSTRRRASIRIPGGSRARIRRSRSGFATPEAAGSIIAVAAALLTGWLISEEDNRRLIAAIEDSLPDALDHALTHDPHLEALIRSLPHELEEGLAYAQVHAIVQVEYYYEESVVWDEIEQTPTMLDSVEITEFSAEPVAFSDRSLPRVETQFNVFESRSRMRFSIPLELEVPSSPMSLEDQYLGADQLRALGMPVPADLARPVEPTASEEAALAAAADRIVALVLESGERIQRGERAAPDLREQIARAWPVPYDPAAPGIAERFQTLLVERGLSASLAQTIMEIFHNPEV